ncbi:glutamate-5-semialdehyde dehydrogenase [Malassezia sp. CBS 17886]|nr:glutamate-5-semialdehyde dehydrogenase [Malassezia sp. CBS 17886]
MSATQVAQQARAAFDSAQKTLAGSGSVHADAARVQALAAIHHALEGARDEIHVANMRDVAEAEKLVASGVLSQQMVARLDLFAKPGKWESMLQGIVDVGRLPTPLDVCTRAKRLAEPADAAAGRAATGALDLYRVTCPIGVLLCIFEARPEVIVNIASLAIKSGNAAILKGGKESKHTAAVLARCIFEALAQSELPTHLVQTVETRDEIQSLLHEDAYIDLVIPRGSNALVRSIQRAARMPVMGHADGLCAVYVHADAPERLAVETVLDAKLDYPSACNAVETLLVHEAQLASGVWCALATALLQKRVRLHCDGASLAALQGSVLAAHPDLAPLVIPAGPNDYDTEFLDLDLAVRTVPDVGVAIDHINQHGSGHTDAILCAPLADGTTHAAAEAFTRSLSSSSVFVNASTRFADGFRFGFGTEVGISTGRTHARGPVGLEGLVTYKYVLRSLGDGAQTAVAFSPGEHQRVFVHRDLPQEYPVL